MCLGLVLGATVLVVGLRAQPSSAASYGDFLGTNIDFLDVNETTASAGDPDGLFGAPVLLGDQLLFFPNTFSASATGGGSDITSALLQATLTSKNDTFIEQILLEEFGSTDLSGLGTGSTNASVSMSGFLTVLADSNGAIAPTVIPFQAVFAQDTFELPGDLGFGQWSGSLMIDVAAVVPNATSAILQLNNTLDVNTEGGTTGLIQKFVLDGPAVTLTVIPEPSSGLLVLMGLLGLGHRSRMWRT